MRRGIGVLVAAVLVGAAIAAGGASASDPLGLTFSAGGNGGQPTVWVAQADGSHARNVGVGSVPLLAPNGESVAFSPQGGSNALVIESPSGTVTGKFFNGRQVSAASLAWSPDSRYLAVQLADTQHLNSVGRSGIAIVDTHTGTTVMVAHGIVYAASWSPTGDKLVYGLAKSVKFTAPTNLYTCDANGGSVKQVTNNGDSLQPVWGKLGIAFDRSQSRGTQKAPLYQIYLLHNGHTTQITHVPVGPLVFGLVPVAVSANGRRLIAEYGGTDTSNAYTVDLGTHATHEVKVHGQTVTGWGISRDGKRLLIVFGGFEQSANHGKVESIPWGGGTPTVLEQHGNEPSWNQ
jgi:dipeptidyl aminopeptidase/acylaminoacyl peptidase